MFGMFLKRHSDVAAAVDVQPTPGYVLPTNPLPMTTDSLHPSANHDGQGS